MTDRRHASIDLACQGATPDRNEDHVLVIESADATDLVVLDGATPVAGRDYIDAGGDVAWFVTSFGTALRSAIHAGLGQHEAVHQAVATVRAQFAGRAAGIDVPMCAWPIAALTWIRATPDGMLHLYALGDCITLIKTPDGAVIDADPWVNPQEAVLRAEIAKLQAAGIADPAARFERLLPLLRARREEQNGSAHPAILCLHPAGPFAARRHAVPAPPGTVLLCMTDGFYRLVDPYALHTPASLVAACEEQGLEAVLLALRAHEAEMAGGTSVKRADDASAVLWRR